MARQGHVWRFGMTRYCARQLRLRGANEPMQYLPLFLLFMAVLIAAYFYLERAKARDAGTKTTTTPAAPEAPATPTDRPAE